MMASPSELSLRSLGDTTHQPPSDHLHAQKLEEQLSRLEEERLKIDAFKRELPLCMQLLTNAVEASRQQLQYCKASTANQVKGPVLEEFIPIKQPNNESLSDQQQAANISSDKANWMTSAQLWSQANDGAVTKQSGTHPSNDPGLGFNPGLSLSEKKQINGGAFLPFTKERSSNSINHVLPELSLTSDEHEIEEKKGLKSESELASENSEKDINGGFMVGNNQTNVAGATTTTSSSTTTTQTNRKQRRCWSPDLHRRFVNALQMLGGSQVATPKQIRELMKVDGLTNDEVKSHLQKYRLHTRRPGPSPQAAGPPGPQLVVLGGIWVPPEYANAAAHHHNGPQAAIYGAHPTAQMASHYCPPRIPQEFYPPPLPHALPQLRHQMHIYKDPSQGHGSPESGGGRGARDRSESIEDGKSESGSWKGDSGDESSEERKRKKLASMKEGDEESNGSEITLKF